METIECNQSPLHNSSANGDENTRFPFLSSRKDGKKLLYSQSHASVFQNEILKKKTKKRILKVYWRVSGDIFHQLGIFEEYIAIF